MKFEEQVNKKLISLNETQVSIETVSQWFIFHKRNADKTVAIWLEHFQSPQSDNKRKLILLYLANDILQNGRKKGDEYINAFKNALAQPLINFFNGCNDDTVKAKVVRVMNIWGERSVFDAEFLNRLKEKLDNVPSVNASTSSKNLSKSSGSPVDNASDKHSKLTNALKLQMQYLDQTSQKINQQVKNNVASSKWKQELSQLVTSRQEFIGKLQNLLQEHEQLLKQETDLLISVNPDPRRMQQKRPRVEEIGAAVAPQPIDIGNLLNTLVPVVNPIVPNPSAPIDPNVLKLFNINPSKQE